MAKLLFKLLLFTLLFISIDMIIGSYIFNLSKIKNGNIKIEKLINNDTSYDMLILGSSRPARNIIASELSATLKMSAYNFAFPGSDIDFHMQLFDMIISSGVIPRYVILAVDDYSELLEADSINFRYDLLYQYADNDKVKKILSERGKFNYIFSKISKTYCSRNALWNSLLRIADIDNMDPLNKHEVDGSMPLDMKSVTWNKMTYNNYRSKYDILKESKRQLHNYMQFVSACKVNKIKLIIVFSPNYFIKSDEFITRIKEITGSDATYFDYTELITDKNLFYDTHHLNKNGAIKLSRKLAKDINESLVGP